MAPQRAFATAFRRALRRSPRKRSIGIRTVVLAAAVVVGGTLSAQVPPRIGGGFDSTQNWLRLAQKHEIGRIDDPARQVASWSPLAYQQLVNDLQLIRLLILNATRQGTVLNSASSSSASTSSSRPSSSRTIVAELRGRRLTLDQVPALLGLSPDAIGGPFDAENLAKADSPARRALAQVMIRAVLLHTDIAMAGPDDLPTGLAGRLSASAVQLRDGRESAVGNVAVHYTVAREAIALVTTAAAGSEVARDWYTATLAFLQADRNYAALLPQLETARVTMPADARIWLWSGAAYENLAAPAVQVAAEGTSARIESPTLLYARAEQFYRHALELEPVYPECWLRLARVRELSGHADEAATLLERAEGRLESPVMKYYAALFAGRAAEASNKLPAARQAYERAMALFPQAQSPRLALAEMAFHGPDQATALSAVRTMFITAGDSRDTDPWWIYDVSLVTNWQDLVMTMRARVAALLEAR